MHFDPQAVPAEMLGLFRRFVAITTWKPWATRLHALERQARDNPFLDEYFGARCALEIEMGRLHQRVQRGDKIRLPRTSTEHALLGFIATTARVYQRLSAPGQHRLAGMLRAGLEKEFGLAPLRHEMTVAAHLMGRGFDVAFSDIETGSGFDVLASKDAAKLEVEHKAFSADLGRQVHRRRLYEFGKYVYPAMQAALSRRPGVQFARIVLPGRLDGNVLNQRELSARLVKTLEEGMPEPGPVPCAVEYRTFSLTGSPFETLEFEALEKEAARAFVEQAAGIPINHVIMLFQPHRGAVVVSVESTQKDRMMDALVRTLKESARRQLTGVRPGAICVNFLDITESELIEIAEQDASGKPSALQIATSRLLSRADWRHVHTVAYLVPGHLAINRMTSSEFVQHSVQEVGKSYVFRNHKHDMAGDARLRIY